MPNQSKDVEEPGTYSAYFNKTNLKHLEAIGLTGLPPAKVIDRLCEKARKFEENKANRKERINEQQRKIDNLRDMNDQDYFE